MTPECPREPDVFRMVAQGRWPSECPADLADHVAGCAACEEALSLARAFAVQHARATSDAPVPAPGAMWWRIEQRARREAAQAAVRPILAAQAIAVAVLVGAAAGLSGWAWPWLRELATHAAELTAPERLAAWTLPLALLAMLLVVAPIVIYFAIDED